MTLRSHPRVDLCASEVLHRGKVFDVVHRSVRLPSGITQDLDLIEHGGAVAIAARDARGRLLLVKQFRAAASDWLVEIPAGRLEPGEEPLAAAKRELEEETGYRAGRWRLLSEFLPAPGLLSEVIYLFEAEDLVAVPGGGLEPDPDEEIEILWRFPAELLDSRDAKTLIAALRAVVHDNQ